MIFIELFFTFFKIGLFTVGGGYAMLPLIRTEVLSKGWLTAEEIVRKHTRAVRSKYCNLYRFCPRRGSRGSFCNARSCASVVSDYSCDCAML